MNCKIGIVISKDKPDIPESNVFDEHAVGLADWYSDNEARFVPTICRNVKGVHNLLLTEIQWESCDMLVYLYDNTHIIAACTLTIKPDYIEISAFCTNLGTKNLGVVLLHAVKSITVHLCKQSVILLDSVYESVPFYEKQGFIVDRTRYKDGLTPLRWELTDKERDHLTHVWSTITEPKPYQILGKRMKRKHMKRRTSKRSTSTKSSKKRRTLQKRKMKLYR